MTASPSPPPGFDRIRPASRPATRPRDPQGRDQLYSAPTRPAGGRGACLLPPVRPMPFAALLECSACGEQTASTLPRALAACVPGLHLPWLRRRHGSYMRCPACRRFTWMSLRLGW